MANTARISYKVHIKKDIIDKSFHFAEELWKSNAQSGLNFGSSDHRRKADYIADTVGGKISEFATLYFLFNNFNVSFVSDMLFIVFLVPIFFVGILFSSSPVYP